MTNLFLKKKPETADGITDSKTREHYGTVGAVFGIICNTVLFSVKLFLGITVKSGAILADGINNLTDTASSAISLISAKASVKPSDREHPFGHGRTEYISSLIISVAVVYAGAELLKQGISDLFNPRSIKITAVAIIILCVSIAVKIFMYFFNLKLAKKIDSPVLRAAAADSLSDTAATGITLASMLIYKFTGVNIDAPACIIISLFIIYEGIIIIKDAFSPLLGQRENPLIREEILEIISEDKNVAGVHDLVIHSYGKEKYMATAHIEVPDSLSLKDAHRIADGAEKRVLSKLGIDLVAHTDPVSVGDKNVGKVKKTLFGILNSTDKRLSFHDLQVSFGDDENIISFDLAMPYEYDVEDENRVLYRVIDQMEKADAKNHCVITVDRGFLEDSRINTNSGQITLS